MQIASTNKTIMYRPDRAAATVGYQDQFIYTYIHTRGRWTGNSDIFDIFAVICCDQFVVSWFRLKIIHFLFRHLPKKRQRKKEIAPRRRSKIKCNFWSIEQKSWEKAKSLHLRNKWKRKNICLPRDRLYLHRQICALFSPSEIVAVMWCKSKEKGFFVVISLHRFFSLLL